MRVEDLADASRDYISSLFLNPGVDCGVQNLIQSQALLPGRIEARFHTVYMPAQSCGQIGQTGVFNYEIENAIVSTAVLVLTSSSFEWASNTH